MREILFRGKSVESKRWVTGDLLHVHGDTVIRGRSGWANVDPDTACQYTGVRDKLLQRIFDGDILKFDWCNEIGRVAWNDKYAMFEIICANDIFSPYFGRNASDEIEIIGNVFDNPELLEVKE